MYGDVGNEPSEIDSRDIIGGDHLLITQVIKPDAVPKLAAPDVIESSDSQASNGGDDVIDGKQNDDVVIAGPGDDTVTGGLGDDTIIGDRGRIDYDTDVVTTPSDLFTLVQIKTTDLNDPTDIPFTGVDTLSGGDGGDTVFGGGKGDTIYGDTETDGTTTIGTPGPDILVGDNGQIDYFGGEVAHVQTTDTTNNTGGVDTVAGHLSDDIILGGVQGDLITGGDDDDMISVTTESSSITTPVALKNEARLGLRAHIGFRPRRDRHHIRRWRSRHRAGRYSRRCHLW